jgi:hypothetical protein
MPRTGGLTGGIPGKAGAQVGAGTLQRGQQKGIFLSGRPEAAALAYILK